jgi:hypothetical protein
MRLFRTTAAVCAILCSPLFGAALACELGSIDLAAFRQSLRDDLCRGEYDFSEEAKMSDLKEGDWMTEIPASVAKQGGAARRVLHELTSGWPPADDWEAEDWFIFRESLIRAKHIMQERRKNR